MGVRLVELARAAVLSLGYSLRLVDSHSRGSGGRLDIGHNALTLHLPSANSKAEAELEPTDWIKIRGSYNRAARAPNVFELFQANDQGFPAVLDPCTTINPGTGAAE